MEILVAAAVAGLVGLAGPWVVRRLPEPPPHPDDPPEDPKLPYATLGTAARTPLLVAALAAVLAGIGAGVLPEPTLLPALVAFCAIGSWLAWVDWRTRLLPYLLTAPLHAIVLLLVALAALLADDWSLLWRGLVGNAVVFVVFWIIWFVGTRVGTVFGYGDVRLAAVIGLLLGPLGVTATLAGTYAGFLLGAVGGIVLSRLGVVDRAGFAFGPYMVVGVVAGLAVVPFAG